MQVSVLLQDKGSEVVTIAPDRSVGEVLAVLAEHRIGAVVVVGEAGGIEGVLSERDVVRALAADGASALDRRAAQLMTREVVTCEPDTTVERLMAVMTERRIRHVPVVAGGRLDAEYGPETDAGCSSHSALLHDGENAGRRASAASVEAS